MQSATHLGHTHRLSSLAGEEESHLGLVISEFGIGLGKSEATLIKVLNAGLQLAQLVLWGCKRSLIDMQGLTS